MLAFFYHFAVVTHSFKHVTSFEKTVSTPKCWLLGTIKNDAFITRLEYTQELSFLYPEAPSPLQKRVHLQQMLHLPFLNAFARIER